MVENIIVFIAAILFVINFGIAVYGGLILSNIIDNNIYSASAKNKLRKTCLKCLGVAVLCVVIIGCVLL